MDAGIAVPKSSDSLLMMLLLLMLAGCAGKSGPSDFWLKSMKQEQTRRVAAECFSRSDDWRFVYGDPAMWIACRNWAVARAR